MLRGIDCIGTLFSPASVLVCKASSASLTVVDRDPLHAAVCHSEETGKVFSERKRQQQ